MAIRIMIGTITQAQKEALINLNNLVVSFINVSGQDAVQIKYRTTCENDRQLVSAALNILEGSKILAAIQKPE